MLNPYTLKFQEMIHVLPGRATILGQDPHRDVEIEEFKRLIEIAGRSGLRGLNYSFGTLENQRTPNKMGRGGATYSTMDWSEYDNSPVQDGRAGTTVDDIFARIQYFLERVVPVAEKWNVQLACHLDDPPAPPLKGVARWDYPVFEGCKRFVELIDSPVNGLNFCCGTASEGLDDPRTELFPIVKYLVCNPHCQSCPPVSGCGSKRRRTWVPRLSARKSSTFTSGTSSEISRISQRSGRTKETWICSSSPKRCTTPAVSTASPPVLFCFK